MRYVKHDGKDNGSDQGAGFSARGVSPVAIYSCTGMRDAELEPILLQALTK